MDNAKVRYPPERVSAAQPGAAPSPGTQRRAREVPSHRDPVVGAGQAAAMNALTALACVRQSRAFGYPAGLRPDQR
ncbi:hypothetical protein GCM10009557_37140 [Virgisporangium ochraceum]